MPSKKEPSSNKRQSALSKVQNLYVMQVKLWDFLEEKNTDAGEVQKILKEYNTLLKEVDPQYMGGEDVYETLLCIPREVNQKLKSKKKPAKKKAATARTTTKKPSAKKTAKKKKK